MLHLVIPFRGSWTNSFADKEFEPLFTSGKSFNQGNRKLEVAPLTTGGRVDQVRALNQLNPDMTYRVPANYDNTAKGVLARLLGEVRRLSDLEADHPLQELFRAMTYSVSVTQEHDEVVSLATPPNPIQTGGAGILKSGNPFYAESPLAKLVFGHINGTMEQLLEGFMPQDAWTPKAPIDLILKLDSWKAQQDALVAALKDSMGESYVSPFKHRAEALRATLAAAGLEVELNLDVDAWHWAGAIIATTIHTLQTEEREQLKAAGFLTQPRGYLKGIAMTGNLGGLTVKDLYEGAGCNKAYSTRIPYSTNLWFTDAEGKKRGFNLGVIVKAGVLEIALDLPDDQANQILNRINDAAVGPLHFGKKGLAYLERAYI